MAESSSASDFAHYKALFLELSELPEAERAARLDAMPQAAELTAKLRRMLANQAEPERLVEQAMVGFLGQMSVARVGPGSVLGAWTLAEKLGEGGMGSVYLAKRSDGNFEQKAAVKVLRGAASAKALDYLAQERQILASLSHPNIARLLDGGATADGHPFLVMEYIDGQPIDRYCRAHKLSERALLKLMLSVISAVNHAHQQLVIHCDLKPSNILVDASGRASLLDFGIARWVSVDTPRANGVLAHQPLAFTPGFSSPEQERGGTLSVASDIYSLGRLLDELLRLNDAVPNVELLALAARASAAEAGDRYASASAMADDVRRFLDLRPLEAMPRAPWYLGKKLLQRRWPLITAITLFVLMSAGFTLRLQVDRDRALQARAEALVERDRAALAERSAQQLSGFLSVILSSVDPDNARSMDRTLMRAMLDQAAARAQRELTGNPAVLAQIESVIADSFAAISEFEPAIAHYRAASTAFIDSGTSRASLPMLRLARKKLSALLGAGKLQAADELLRQTLSESTRVLGPQSELTLALQSFSARLLFAQGKRQDALRRAEATQKLFDAHAGIGPETWLEQLHILSILYSDTRDYNQARAQMERAIALASQHYGALNSKTLRARHSLAVMLLQSNQNEAAVTQLTSLLADSESALGPRHLLTISAMSNLGMAVRFSGKLAESAPYYQGAYARARAQLGANNPLTLDLGGNLAIYEIAAGRPQKALDRIDKVIARLTLNNPRLHPSLLEALRTRAKALAALGRTQDSREAWADVIARDIEFYGLNDAQTLEDQAALGSLR